MMDSISGDETAPRRPRKRERERFQISVDARHFPAFFFDDDDDEERRRRRRRAELRRTDDRRTDDARRRRATKKELLESIRALRRARGYIAWWRRCVRAFDRVVGRAKSPNSTCVRTFSTRTLAILSARACSHSKKSRSKLPRDWTTRLTSVVASDEHGGRG